MCAPLRPWASVMTLGDTGLQCFACSCERSSTLLRFCHAAIFSLSPTALTVDCWAFVVDRYAQDSFGDQAAAQGECCFPVCVTLTCR